MLRPFTSLAAAALLASCTTPPLAMDSTHPASTTAPEAATPAARSTLRADANTLRTRELLSQRARQADAVEAETPVDQGSPSPDAARTSPGPMHEIDGMKDMKGMKGMEGHENH